MDILFTTVVIILIVAALMSMVISFFVFALYYNFESKKPHEVVEISQDGFVYKLENGKILSVFKIKKYILKGYIYWIGTRDNVIKYNDLNGKLVQTKFSSLEEDDIFTPAPYQTVLKFKTKEAVTIGNETIK